MIKSINYIKKNQIYKYKIFFLLCCLLVYFIKTKTLKLAICTMARDENLYINEYLDYYFKLGFDHIYIFDDNEKVTDNISQAINDSYKNYVTIYNYRRIIKDQRIAYTLCYEMNKNKYDWIFMNDIDEYLVIKNESLKHYLSRNRFKKCDFIKFHWVLANDNNLLYYDNRSLFERFKPPYKLDTHITTMVRGNIDDLQYDIHTPFISPHRNVSCDNKGNIYKNKEILFQDVFDINIDTAFIIHYKYKSTEEYINKYKRGYKDWPHLKMMGMIQNYFKNNKLTIEKVEMFENELNITLDRYRRKLHKPKK